MLTSFFANHSRPQCLELWVVFANYIYFHSRPQCLRVWALSLHAQKRLWVEIDLFLALFFPFFSFFISGLVANYRLSFAWNCTWLTFQERNKFNFQRVLCKQGNWQQIFPQNVTFFVSVSLSGSSSETQGQIKGARESLNGRKNIYVLRAKFFRPFRLFLVPTICPWVSEDVSGLVRISKTRYRWKDLSLLTLLLTNLLIPTES